VLIRFRIYYKYLALRLVAIILIILIIPYQKSALSFQQLVQTTILSNTYLFRSLNDITRNGIESNLNIIIWSAFAINDTDRQPIFDITTDQFGPSWPPVFTITFGVNPLNSGNIICDGTKIVQINQNYGFRNGTMIECQAKPNYGFKLISWSGLDYNTQNNNITIINTKDRTLIANFRQVPVSDNNIFGRFSILYSEWIGPISQIWTFVAGIGAVIVPIIVHYYRKKKKNEEYRTKYKRKIEEISETYKTYTVSQGPQSLETKGKFITKIAFETVKIKEEISRLFNQGQITESTYKTLNDDLKTLNDDIISTILKLEESLRKRESSP